MTSSKSNPSLGLHLWGPLVPANDCKSCLFSLATIQLGAGAFLCLRPGRRVPSSRNVWTNRFLKLGGIVAGSYLVFTAGIEYARLALAYDPWVDDARRARKQDLDVNHTFSLAHSWKNSFDLKQWKYWWFGPTDYEAVPWEEWKRRTTERLEKAQAAREGMDGVARVQEKISNNNLATAAGIHKLLSQGKLDVQEPEGPVVDAGWSENDVSDEEIFEELDFSDANLWELFEEPRSFSLVVLPRAAPVFIPKVNFTFTGEETQNVNYAPIPQYVKRF